jgi:hypothetical protein
LELQPHCVTPTRADLLIGLARVHLQAFELADALRALQVADAD